MDFDERKFIIIGFHRHLQQTTEHRIIVYFYIMKRLIGKPDYNYHPLKFETLL